MRSARGIRCIGWLLAGLAFPGAGQASEVGCPGRVVVPAAQASAYPPGVGNACSLPLPPDDLYAAASDDDYAGSQICGRCARITGPEGSVTVRFVDRCPRCPAGDLDLSEAAFAAIADPEDGLAPISWETVACDVGAAPMQLVFQASHEFYLKVQVRDHRHGIASVELRQGDAWLAMARTSDDHFERAGGSFAAPLSFRIEDVHGQVVESDPVAIVNDTPQDAGVQLVPCPEPGRVAGLAALAAVASLPRARGRIS
jgi:hypothetical protein